MSFRSLRSYCLLFAVIALQTAVRADIAYLVTPSEDGKTLAVQMEFAVSSTSVDLQMPSWSPGLYAVENYWKTVSNISATDENGRALAVTHSRDDTWRVASNGQKRIKVRYDRSISRAGNRMGMFSSDDKAIHYGGPTVYMYVVGRKEERCTVEFAIPESWKVAVSLKDGKNNGNNHTYVAKNYDILADCPVTMGDFIEDRYLEGGAEYVIAYRGPAKDKIDRKKALSICHFITKSETEFFGGAPFGKYVWHIWVSEGRDGAGGVEHATSSQDFVATGLGKGALAGLAHEFFHLWNVKRIRSKVLGPFDYTQLPKTGALWWLEGVTDYYAHILPYRNGAWGREQFLADIIDEVRRVRENAARLEVSPYDAGYRIPEAKTSFSSGYRVNYYPTGWVLGMLFDIELRTRTGGKKSLDDVERALWKLCKNDKPGFQEDEIRKQLIRFGGTSMGELYDQWVLKPGELPMEAQLSKVGLEIAEREGGQGVRSGIIRERADITPAQRTLLEGWLKSREAAHVL